MRLDNRYDVLRYVGSRSGDGIHGPSDLALVLRAIIKAGTDYVRYLLGDFTFTERKPVETDERIAEVFGRYLRDLRIPVLSGLSAGHIRENFALPMNALFEVNADEQIVRVCERTVH